MSSAALDEEPEKPLDPAMEKVRRKMIRLLAISIAVMMAGLMAVLFAIVYKMNSKPPVAPVVADLATPSGAGEISGSIALPAGAQINGQSLSGNRILFDLSLPDGARELAIFDIAANRFVARYALTNTKP
ncbi:MAG: fimbrial protein [Rhizobiaceae bacterium]